MQINDVATNTVLNAIASGTILIMIFLHGSLRMEKYMGDLQIYMCAAVHKA